MREVIFFGFGFKSGQDVTIKGRELWTTNDWYKWHPQIKPSRLYQIHANKSREKPYKDKHGFIRMVDYWDSPIIDRIVFSFYYKFIVFRIQSACKILS